MVDHLKQLKPRKPIKQVISDIFFVETIVHIVVQRLIYQIIKTESMVSPSESSLFGTIEDYIRNPESYQMSMTFRNTEFFLY